jgi:ABC-2 type transport system ATP-binding protein
MKRRIGFLPENPYFYDHLTAEELLTYFARLFGLRGPEVGTRVARVLDDVGLGAERRLRLRQYSKGMVQRVGLAQALLNEPEVVFLDEPMSGLDPLGRRHVRQLMLRLRDRGCTVFFSSHILSDAETLCSRVGIVAQGRLVSTGRLSEILAFELRGWEVVVANLGEAVRERLRPRARSITPLAHDRYTIELPADVPPDHFLQELGAGGAQIVSLNPLRETLEDYFVQSVSSAASRETGLQQ